MVIWDFAYTGLGGCKRDALPTELTAPNLLNVTKRHVFL